MWANSAMNARKGSSFRSGINRTDHHAETISFWIQHQVCRHCRKYQGPVVAAILKRQFASRSSFSIENRQGEIAFGWSNDPALNSGSPDVHDLSLPIPFLGILFNRCRPKFWGVHDLSTPLLNRPGQNDNNDKMTMAILFFMCIPFPGFCVPFAVFDPYFPGGP